jgi:hypothetical protein
MDNSVFVPNLAGKQPESSSISHPGAQVQTMRFKSFAAEHRQPDNNCHNMSLPRELRDIVFDELWKLELIRQLQFKGDAVESRYDNIKADQQHYLRGLPAWLVTHCWRGLPTWLLTNRSFLDEGMAQFHFKSAWSFSPSFGLSKKGEAAYRDTSLLNMSTARHLTIDTGFLRIGPQKIFSFSVENKPRLDRALRYLYQAPKLCTVRLSTVLHFPKSIDDIIALAVDLDYIDRIYLNICKFEFEVRDTDSENMTVWNILRLQLLLEVGRIGMTRVGGKKKARDEFVIKSDWLTGGSKGAFRITYEKSEK